MVGKVIISLVWVFWILAMSTVEGQDPSAVSQDDYDSLHAEVIELRKIKKIHQQMLPQGEKNYKMKDEYFPAYGSTLARVKKRGYIICGTYPDFPGFSEEVEEAEESKVWVGFDIDICRAVASAVFGNQWRIQFIGINGRTRFERLIDGSIDVLSAATTWTFSRDVEKKLEYVATTYFDGQGFMVRKNLGVSSAKQLVGASVCFSGSSTAAQNIRDFFEYHEIKFVPIEISADQSVKELYAAGECDMYGTDRSGLASNRLSFDDPERHMILPEVISKEPLGPVVKYGDQQWADIVRWSIFVLFLAEEMEITQDNIDGFKQHKNPSIQRFMGERNGEEHPNLGIKLGLDKLWAYYIIKQLGNYGEIYERNVGINTPIGLNRGLNKLYIHGGLLYAPPLR
jgi:general L-amino acid transport system substrate-binding protein